MLKPNTEAPNFSLPDQNGEIHSLADYRGKSVLVYFYPKDDTSGCTKEACMIRDNFSMFQKANCIVLGISADSVKSHGQFVEKYSLPFTLLADQKKEVIKKYGITGRSSYLINPQGLIIKAYSDVDPAQHASEVLKDL